MYVGGSVSMWVGVSVWVCTPDRNELKLGTFSVQIYVSFFCVLTFG